MTLSSDEIEALLPFLANGTLDGDELQEVTAAVAADPQLAFQLAALRGIRDTMQSEGVGSSPGEFGLARLMRDVRSEQSHDPSKDTTVVRPRIW